MCLTILRHLRSKRLINNRMIKQFVSLYAMLHVSMSLAVAALDYLLLSICFIAFACNAKSFAIVYAVFFFFSFSSSFLAGPPKAFLRTFYQWFPKKRVAKNGLISKDTLRKFCVKIILLVAIRDPCGI